jgi:hypothetical protein
MLLMRWAVERGCPYRRGLMCEIAAKGGHLETLKWAGESGLPWDYDPCARAAEGGHLEVLQWVVKRGSSVWL